MAMTGAISSARPCGLLESGNAQTEELIMFKRFLFCLPLIAFFTTALAQIPAPRPPAPVTPVPSGPVGGGQTNGDAHPSKTPCDCCAGKPHYADNKDWTPFIGTVAVMTQQRPQANSSVPSLMDQVVVIWDLHIKSGVPFDTWWTTTNPPSNPTTRYFSDPTWNYKNLGDVFGQTLDDKGNIYVAATAVYGSGSWPFAAGNQVGSIATGGSAAKNAGQIYKIPSNTATPTPVAFALLPSDANGIGNLHYDCDFASLYATNFYDGLIYRIDATGVIQPLQWDHGANLASATDAAGNPLGRTAIPITAKDGSSSFTALGRRVWAVTLYKNRLWYSVWNDNGTSFMSNTSTTGIPNEIWSVALDANGDAIGPARLEITLPQLSATQKFSQPVSDMAFGPMGTLLVTEHSMSKYNVPGAHQSRALEYSFNGTAWVLANPAAYKVGSVFTYANSAGSGAFDFSPGGGVWVTGDALHHPNAAPYTDLIYGLQGFPPGGGDIHNSILIDADNYVIGGNKTQLGVVRIPCPECTNPPQVPVITGPRSACNSPSTYSVTPQAGVTFTWAVTGGTPSTATGSTINVNWTGGPGTITVTTGGPGKCGAVSTFVSVAACTNCEFCSQFKTSLSLANPLNVGGGSYYIRPTVTSTMSGVRSVTTTLLSTSVGYSAAVCGGPGPLASYIPQAYPSSSPMLNAPTLTVSNGNQGVWYAPSTVNLTGGATTPFQLNLPPPPALNPPCSANFSLCLRVSLATTTCQNCDQIQCFGPYPYTGATHLPSAEVIDTSRRPPAPVVLPDGTIREVPESGAATSAPR
jgi:hypothetical protein